MKAEKYYIQALEKANTEAEVMEVLDTMGQLLEETRKIIRK